MQINSPLEITARLMPGFTIDNGTVSIGYSGRPGTEGRIRYVYHIDLQANSKTADPPFTWMDDDLQSGCGGGSLQEGLASLLSFLETCAEAIHWGGDEPGENADLFPEPIAEWAAANSDELSSLAVEREETPNLIVE